MGASPERGSLTENSEMEPHEMWDTSSSSRRAREGQFALEQGTACAAYSVHAATKPVKGKIKDPRRHVPSILHRVAEHLRVTASAQPLSAGQSLDRSGAVKPR